MTVVTCLCLSVVFLFNKFHYWLAASKNKGYIVKPYLIVQKKLPHHENSCFICKREISSSNFFNMCVHMCIINLRVYGMSLCIFMFSLFFMGLKMTTSFYLYPILRFNNADWFYLQWLPVGVYCTVIRLHFQTVSLLVCGLIYIYMYICIYERYDVVM